MESWTQNFLQKMNDLGHALGKAVSAEVMAAMAGHFHRGEVEQLQFEGLGSITSVLARAGVLSDTFLSSISTLAQLKISQGALEKLQARR